MTQPAPIRLEADPNSVEKTVFEISNTRLITQLLKQKSLNPNYLIVPLRADHCGCARDAGVAIIATSAGNAAFHTMLVIITLYTVTGNTQVLDARMSGFVVILEFRIFF